MIRFIFCLLLFCSLQLSGRIAECHSTKVIEKEIEKDTLVLFDIDKTTLTTSTHLGSPSWFDHLRVKVAQWGLPKEAVIPLIHKVMKQAPHIPVEEATPLLIANLQDKGHLVWALTARIKTAPWDPYFDRTTALHLKGAGIDFEQTQLPEDLSKKTFPATFSYGIIFTDWQPKGPILKNFLQALNYRPAKVVLIDDQLEFLQSVEKAMTEMKIPFVGFHYRYCETWDRPFDILISNIQLQNLDKKGVILSEKEALFVKKRILKQNPSINPDFYLDKLLSGLVKQQVVLK